MKRAGVAGALLLALALALMLALGAAEQPSPEGTFALDRAASDDVKATVDRAAAEFNVFMRPFARSRLTKANPVPQQVKIAYTAIDVSVQLDGTPPVKAPRDGTSVTWRRDDGAVFRLSARTEGTTLRQSFEGEEGKRVNVYRLRPDGKLSLEVTLTSPRLPKPLAYTLVFRPVEIRP